MRKIIAKEFTGNRAWAAMDIEEMECASLRLHWTDKPYIWHVNDGPEVFVVLDGEVDMHTRSEEGEETFHLKVGDIFHVQEGDEHMAHPRGAARILVVEKAGSI
ncbi:cupin domain-containing protein [Flexibacterium corallicola]|uniref:cupin domain-containing protein n=1 Tax=Flexibacterium corallicola TaxID=3037259 RepID=UPI00286F1222|nr:cupin domain-containing protein [Pseudovibrio sp. M1P-2-3]